MHILVWLFPNLSKQKRENYSHRFYQDDCSKKNICEKYQLLGSFVYINLKITIRERAQHFSECQSKLYFTLIVRCPRNLCPRGLWMALVGLKKGWFHRASSIEIKLFYCHFWITTDNLTAIVTENHFKKSF